MAKLKSDSLWDKYRTWSIKKDSTITIYKNYLNNSGCKKDIMDFLNVKDTLYAHSSVDKGLDNIQKLLDGAISEKDKQDFMNTRSALRDLQKFLRTNPICCRIEGKKDEKLDEKRNKIAKSSLHKIDGIESIIKSLGTEEAFIKLAVESSYFFDPDLVNARNCELSELIKMSICTSSELKGDLKRVPARKSDSDNNYKDIEKSDSDDNYKDIEKIYTINTIKDGKEITVEISVEIDKDGNKAVRELINDKTGYTIGQGKDSIFQNYNLSHVWGKAYDPRYFTSLWNIVVIPSWANHLMDKEAPEQGSIASKMINTYKKICIKLYSLQEFNWRGIEMDSNDVMKITEDDIVKEKAG